MTLQETIKQQLHQAMKAKDAATTQVLRLVNAALLDARVKATTGGARKELSEAEVIAVLDGMVKRGLESARLYREAGDETRARVEEKEIAIVQSFLPTRLDEAATTKIVQEVITALNASSMRDMGGVMAKLQADHAAQLDKTLTAKIVKRLLSDGGGG